MLFDVLTRFQGLKALHQCGWVHRDISMGNILIDSDNRARLTDFEYAERVGASEQSYGVVRIA